MAPRTKPLRTDEEKRSICINAGRRRGYLNRTPSSRWLELSARHNGEAERLTGTPLPDHKTIADFRLDNGVCIRKVCAKFVELCCRFGKLKDDCDAIGGSKFRAVDNYEG